MSCGFVRHGPTRRPGCWRWPWHFMRRAVLPPNLTSWPPISRSFSKATRRGGVAVDEATLAGFAVTTVGFGLESGRVAVLEDLYTAPEHRRRGIGRSLVEDSARWARTMGSRHVELVVAPNGQDVSHLFDYYASLGFLDETGVCSAAHW